MSNSLGFNELIGGESVSLDGFAQYVADNKKAVLGLMNKELDDEINEQNKILQAFRSVKNDNAKNDQDIKVAAKTAQDSLDKLFAKDTLKNTCKNI